MADNLTTPIANGTAMATKDLAGVHIPKNVIVDQAGVDAVGLVATSPAANTILGRLKAIVDALTAPASGIFFPTTQPVSAAALPLPTGAATEATAAAASAKLPASLGAKAGSASFSITPATDAVFGISASSLPLPTGAATAAKQDALKATVDATALVLPPFPITPGSSALARPITAVAIKTAGTVVYTPTAGGSDVTVDLPAGMFPLPATHIKSSSTATGLTGF